MSQHNTMTSNVSDMRSQQQLNLLQLQNLQQHARSLTSTTNNNNVLQKTTSNTINNTNNSNNNNNTQTNQTTNTNSNNTQRKKSLNSNNIVSRNSLQKQRLAKQQQDPRSPLSILLPTQAQPTDILAARFGAWRQVIKSLLIYLNEIASIQDEIIRQQLRLSHAIQFPFFNIENGTNLSNNGNSNLSDENKSIQNFFLPLGNGSIHDVPTILNQYHTTLASVASKSSKELTNEIIPRLQELRNDLLIKIKEIKSLQSDFKNNCNKELNQTKNDLKQYIDSIKDIKYNNIPKIDPYLAKLVLDKQIKRQIMEENFLHEAFDNLQNSGAELEKVVVMEVQNAITIYARMLGQQAQIVFDILISKLDMGFFSKDPNFEWDNFISRNNNFISPNLPMRKFKEIVYKYQFDPMTYEIKSGFLERRSKFLKSYSRGFYVLTPNFLHEFKSSDRKKDLIPVMSLSLSDCSVAEHSKKESSDHKFILHAKQNGIIHRGHNWVFKCDSYETMISWFHNLKKFTTFNNSQEKSKYIMDKLNVDKDGKLKLISTNSSMRDDIPKKRHENRNANFPSTVSTTTSNNLSLDENASFSTQKLDNATHTNTTSSIPDTNDSQLQDNIPSLIIDTIDDK